MGRKKNIKTFNIATPDVRTVYLGTGVKQKARFIQLHDNFGFGILKEDIEAGAVIYEPFLDELEHKTTRYNFITASSEEDGLRAVAYLAGIHVAGKGYDPGEIDTRYYDDDECSQEYEEEIDIYDDETDEGGEELYSEDFSRIPIIEINEVVPLESNHSPQFGFSAYGMEMQNNTKKPRPWWDNCCDNSVCVIKNDSESNFFGWSPETLDAQEIACLKRFKSNEHVYVLIITDEIRSDDFSLNTAMLDYTANCFRVETKNTVLSKYYLELFKYETSRFGFALSKTMDVELLADKISKIDKQYPCSKFEKVMKYLLHIEAPHTLKASDFDSLGLKKLIDRTPGDTAGTLDVELTGMDSVKKQVNNVMNMLRFVRLRSSRDIRNNGFHNVHLFIGAPGTAKTTVARIMAKSMQEEGLLPGNRFISVTGAQLKGSYVGQTAPKVHALFEQHDAIFIDEAYSLTAGSENEGGIDSYSQEALAQLAVELEEHATDKLVIFAGYGGRNTSKKNNLMYKFLKSNPGISSRINSTIYFDSYTPEDMVGIVHHLASKASFILAPSLDKMIADYFDGRMEEEDFGNGREARVLLEQCERHVAERVASKDPEKITDKELNTILDCDVEAAIKELKEMRSDQMGAFLRGYGLTG